MTAIAARHARPRFSLAALIPGFLRPLRRAAEEEAAPAPVAGAAALGLYGIPDGWSVGGSGGFAVLVPPAPRHAGTQPRQQLPARTRRPGKQPWDTMQMPLLRDPEPEPPHAWDPGDGLDSPVPLARPYVAQAQEDAYPCCKHCVGFVCDQPYHPAPCSDGCNG